MALRIWSFMMETSLSIAQSFGAGWRAGLFARLRPVAIDYVAIDVPCRTSGQRQRRKSRHRANLLVRQTFSLEADFDS
jgi:hypothetical protein